MKFREYYEIPQNLKSLPAGTIDAIELEGEIRGGAVHFYLPIPQRFPTKKGLRWMSVWQLLEYNIYTDQLLKLYPYRMVTEKGVMPSPDTHERYFTPEYLPVAVRKMLKDKVKYYKVRAKQL